MVASPFPDFSRAFPSSPLVIPCLSETLFLPCFRAEPEPTKRKRKRATVFPFLFLSFPPFCFLFLSFSSQFIRVVFFLPLPKLLQQALHYLSSSPVRPKTEQQLVCHRSSFLELGSWPEFSNIYIYIYLYIDNN